MVLAFFLLRSVLSGFVQGRCFKERRLMKIPFLGRVYRNSILSRLADAMALLIGSGCDIPECLRLGAGASGSEKLKQECELLAGQIEQGFNIMEAGQLCSMIPRLFLYSVQLGAQRNELQDNLYSLSEMYAQQAKSSQMKMSVVLLPLMLILVGGILATAVIAMFLPMVRMINILS
jgi:type IV pilus assembly protein PilC